MTSSSSISNAMRNATPSVDMGRASPVTIATLVAILILPGMIFFLFGTSSMSAGVLAAAILILSMRAIGLPGMRALGHFSTDATVALLIITLLSVHLVVRSLVVEIDTVKAAGSLVMAALTIMACGTVGSLFRQAPDRAVRQAVAVSVTIFILAVIFSLAEIQPSSTTATSKPIFPFTEPSLFAGALLPIIAFLGVTGKGWRRWVWILTGFLFGYLLENLSLVVGSVVVTIACLTAVRLAMFATVAVLVMPLLNLSYFIERIQFDVSATTNLSALVYIQGWEMIGAATRATWGWGLGFQQLGYTFLDAPTSNLIYRLTGGMDLNLKEGSFAAAKLISELGIFGAVLIALHLFFAVKSFLKIRRVAVDGIYCPAGEVLALCSVYTYIVDMYVRGAGYFSSPTMLIIASIFLLKRPALNKQ